MSRIFIFTFVLAISFSALSQNSVLTGNTLRIEDDVPAKDLHVYLMDSSKIKLDSAYTDVNGFFSFKALVPGNYSLKVLDAGIRFITNIQIGYNDSVYVKVATYKPCISSSRDSICPLCNKTDKVLPIEPNLMVSYYFTSEKKSKKAWEKVKKRGYGLHTLDNGRKVVKHPFFIESEEDKFRNPCFNWFCTRDEHVF
jgi:hypothetical protein